MSEEERAFDFVWMQSNDRRGIDKETALWWFRCGIDRSKHIQDERIAEREEFLNKVKAGDIVWDDIMEKWVSSEAYAISQNDE